MFLGGYASYLTNLTCRCLELQYPLIGLPLCLLVCTHFGLWCIHEEITFVIFFSLLETTCDRLVPVPDRGFSYTQGEATWILNINHYQSYVHIKIKGRNLFSCPSQTQRCEIWLGGTTPWACVFGITEHADCNWFRLMYHVSSWV